MIKVRCPVCEKWIEGASRAELPELPFCSARCRLIDLGRWLGERYGIEADAESDEAVAAPDESTIP